MKTKTIEVWVWKSDINNKHSISIYPKADRSWENELFKAKLIIEIPEKKIEITEDAIDEAFDTCVFSYDDHEVENFKKELGF